MKILTDRITKPTPLGASRILLLLLCGMLFVLVACDRPAPAPPPPVPTVTRERTIEAFIRDGDTTGFVAWLSTAADLNAPLTNGLPPLFMAIEYDRSALVDDLLEHGADPRRPIAQGVTPLHFAARLGRTAIIGKIFEAGGIPTAIDDSGLSAFDYATMAGFSGTAAAVDTIRATYLELMVEATRAPEPEPELEEIPPVLLLSTDFRSWTSFSGDVIDAAFIQSIFDTVILQDRQGELFRIAINRLSAADQALVRQLSGLDPHALAGARSLRATAPVLRDSLALRIGRDRDWTVLENCRLLKHNGNDGDSFHIKHDGKEYIIRLYFVDAAETSLAYPQRVRDQENYFGLSTQDTLKLGEAATRLVTSLLASKPFTVVTKWEDARGNSRLPRHYGLVVTELGDLDELLVREGLVRRYGMPVRTSHGERKQSILRQLEKEAQRNEAGAWGKGDERRADR